jgi:hypothetical protein
VLHGWTDDRYPHAIQVISPRTGSVLFKLRTSDGWGWHGWDWPAVFTPDGSALFIRRVRPDEQTNDLVQFDPRAGRQVRVVVEDAWADVLALSGEQHRLLGVKLKQHLLQRWDLRTGKELDALALGSMPLTAAGFSPDGCLLATAAGCRRPDSKDKLQITLWDTRSRRAVGQFDCPVHPERDYRVEP